MRMNSSSPPPHSGNEADVAANTSPTNYISTGLVSPASATDSTAVAAPSSSNPEHHDDIEKQLSRTLFKRAESSRNGDFGIQQRPSNLEAFRNFTQSWRAAGSEELERKVRPVGGEGRERTGSSHSGIRSADEEEAPDENPSRQNSHAFKPEIVANLLETDITNGLTSEEAAKRLEHYGPNKLHEPPSDTFLKRLGRQLNDVLTWILIVTAIISAGLQSWPEFGLIIGIVFINITIGMVQEGKAAKATAALKSMLSSKATVIRDGGQRMEIDAQELVPGDLVFVESGSKVPADLRITNCTNLAVQEAMLTGESLPTQKDAATVALNTGLGDRCCILYSATLVVRGQGYGLCVATGDTTEIGRIAELVSEVQDSKSELLQQIDAFGMWIGMLVIPVAVVTFLVAYLTPVNLDSYYMSDERWRQALITAIAVAVSMIPAGLPAIITICMAVATQEMARKKAIVKTLPSVEVLGAVSVICSDKTGTLTKNEMTVVAVRTREREYDVKGVGYDWREVPQGNGAVQHVDPNRIPDRKPSSSTNSNGGKEDADKAEVHDSPSEVLKAPLLAAASFPADDASSPKIEDDSALQSLARAGLLNNESRLEPTDKQVLPIGDPTECSLLCLGYKLGLGSNTTAGVQAQYPRTAVIPFESDHKFMATFHSLTQQNENDKDHLLAIVKGAPDRLLPRCEASLLPDGTLKKATDDDFLTFWQAQIAHFSAKGYRCLALCQAKIKYDELPQILAQGPNWISKASTPMLTILGIVAILDPPRTECIAAIKEAHRAGITVKMVTGDHPSTARAIGKTLGIVDDVEHSMVLTGPQLDSMAPGELEKVVRECNVFARASPDNKISIVRALQSHNLICSMTGDGVNDAPALRAADIGVAMGITGTDVSKDAAKMILTDDNFATILVAVRQGRRVWDNLRKIVLFNMPANFAQAGVIFVSVCLQWDTIPLTAIQALYVNMVIACTLGLILALEPAEAKAMHRPPRRLGKGFIGKMFYWRLIFVSFFLILFVLLSVEWAKSIGPYSAGSVRAVAFNCLVLCQTFYAFNCRFLKLTSCNKRVFFGNPGAWFCAVLVIGLNCLLTYTPAVNDFFGMDPMDGLEWLIVLFFAVLMFGIVEIEKALTDPLKPYYTPIVDFFDAMFMYLDRFNVCKKLYRTSKNTVKKMLKTDRKLRLGASMRAISSEDADTRSTPNMSKRIRNLVGKGWNRLTPKDKRSPSSNNMNNFANGNNMNSFANGNSTNNLGNGGPAHTVSGNLEIPVNDNDNNATTAPTTTN